MKTIFKTISVFANILFLIAGIWVTLVTLLKLDFYSIFFIQGMTSAESLYFNMIMFVIGIAALMFVLPSLLEEKAQDVEFPTIFALLPLSIGIINIICAFSLSLTREKIVVIAASVLYIVLFGTTIYNGAKIFQSK